MYNLYDLRDQILLLLLTFGNTCIIEFVIAFLMKIRTKRVYLLIFFVNMLTNPLVNLLYFYGRRWAESYFRAESFFDKGLLSLFRTYGLSVDVQILIVLEILVILCETWIYRRFQDWIPHPFRYALLANMSSALLGGVLQYVEIVLFGLLFALLMI